MIIVPLLASLGITIPKTFSKSITSPAATGECVEVLMKSELTKQEIIKLIDQNGCCLARNGNLNLAPANDRIIKVSAPLGMEPYARMISSIMAKTTLWESITASSIFQYDQLQKYLLKLTLRELLNISKISESISISRLKLS